MDKIYKKIIQDSDIGYAYHKVILDHKGLPCHSKCIETNKAFEKYTGLKVEDLTGEKINNILPRIVKKDIELIEFYEKIAIKGEKKEYEKYFKNTDTWCNIKIFSPEKYHFAINCIDITETKKDLLNKIDESRRILWQVVNAMPSKMFWKDKDFKYLGCNKEFAENLGYSIEEIIGKNDYELGRKDLSELYRKDDEAVIKTGISKLNFEREIIMPNGEKRWIRSNKIPLYDNNNNIYGLFGTLDDITVEKEVEKELKNSQLRTEQLIRESRSIVWETDKNGMCTYISPVVKEVLGYSPDEIIGKKYIYEAFERGAKESCRKCIFSSISKKETISDHESKLKTKNNEEVWLSTNGFPILDDENNLISYRGISIDITHFKKIEKEIRFLSFRDQLTGLYNRRFFEEELERLDTERNLPLSLAVIDVDGLKLVNDAFGHRAGDLLIKKVANIMSRESRADDIISRIGGDEFVILLPKTSLEETKNLIDRINGEIKKEQIEAINISISYGYETKRNINENIDDIFKKADIKMYSYKNAKSRKLRKENIETILGRLFEKSVKEKTNSRNVSEISIAIGKLLNLDDGEIQKLKMIGKFHDIGKIVVSQDILTKKDKLTKEEWEEVKRHSELGYIILSSSDEYIAFAKDVLYHHERYDGTGYPKGLKGEEIPLNARIVALADAYDIITSDRSYKKAVSRDQARDIILKESGKQFDPKIVKTFLKSNIMEEYISMSYI